MGLAVNELYVVFRKRGGFLLVVLFVCLQVFFCLNESRSNRDINFDVLSKQEIYMEYMDVLAGRNSSEKNGIIGTLTEQYNEMESALSRAAEQFLGKKITTEQYNRTLKKYEDVLQRRQIILKLQEQNEYVLSDEQHHYWMDENGWIYLFEESKLSEFLLFLSVLFLLLPIFNIDYERQMYEVNAPAVYGKEKLYQVRFFCGFIVAFLMVFLQFVIRISFAGICFGLQGGLYPAQSLGGLFSTLQWDVNCLEMLLLFFCTRLMGVVLTAVLVLAVSVFVRRMLDTGVLLAVLIFFPLVGCEEAVRYRFPFPGMFLFMDGCVTGIWDEQTGEMVFMTGREIAMLFFAALCMVGLLSFVGLWMYCGNRRLVIRKSGSLLLLLCCVISLGGCGGRMSETDAASQVYQMQAYTAQLCSDEWFVYQEKGTWKKRDLKRDEESDLFQDPFLTDEDAERVQMNFLFGDFLYYSRQLNDGGFQVDYEFVKMNLDTGEESIIYRKQTESLRGMDFMDIYQFMSEKPNRLSDEEKDVRGFFLSAGELFVIQDEKLFAVSTKTGKKRELLNDLEGSGFICAGRRIYYIAQDYLLYRYDLDSQKKEQISQEMVKNIFISGDRLIYSAADNRVYLRDLAQDEEQMLMEKDIIVLDADENGFYYTTDEYTVDYWEYGKNQERRVYSGKDMIVGFSYADGRYLISLIEGKEMDKIYTEIYSKD